MFFKPKTFYFKKLKFIPNLVLASQSPRRKELIRKITDDFICVPADVDEIVGPNTDAFTIPVVLARKKALEVAKRHPQSTVIGCDTVVILNSKVLGKPSDDTDAFNMLKELSGKKHSVVTGCCIIKNSAVKTFSVVSEVWFKQLPDRSIYKYIKTREPFDKAGGYGIQSKGKKLVKKFSGDYYNIVGFPIKAIRKELILINK